MTVYGQYIINMCMLSVCSDLFHLLNVHKGFLLAEMALAEVAEAENENSTSATGGVLPHMSNNLHSPIYKP